MQTIGTKTPEDPRLVAEYHGEAFALRPFVPGKTPIHYAGRVFDADELTTATEAVLDFWLTAGRFSDEFESGLASFFPVESAMLVNSGSSANLLAVSSLTSASLGDRRLRPGDEVITVPPVFPPPSTPSCKTVQCPSSSTLNWAPTSPA